MYKHKYTDIHNTNIHTQKDTHTYTATQGEPQIHMHRGRGKGRARLLLPRAPHVMHPAAVIRAPCVSKCKKRVTISVAS